jgi:hypothetical protein
MMADFRLLILRSADPGSAVGRHSQETTLTLGIKIPSVPSAVAPAGRTNLRDVASRLEPPWEWTRQAGATALGTDGSTVNSVAAPFLECCDLSQLWYVATCRDASLIALVSVT